MHRIFAGMAAWAALLMLANGVLGVMTKRIDPGLVGLHMMVGVLTGIFVCILHVMVMFHFIGSGKEMKQAIQLLGDQSDLVKRLRRLKMQVMPPATFAPVFVGAAVIFGGEAQMKIWGIGGWLHWTLGAIGFVFNLWAFPIEYRCLVTNLEMLREVDERVKREISPGLYQ